MSHTGCGSSQIDYILCSDKGLMKSTSVQDRHHLNQSAHTVVSAEMNFEICYDKAKTMINKCKKSIKIDWGKADECKFKQYWRKN